MDIIQKVALSVFFSVALVACGGGGDSSDASSSNTSPDGTKKSLSVGVYKAINGLGYSDYHKLKLDKGSYLDITTFKSAVGLYDSSLAVIDANLASSDYIPAGEYNLKFTYESTSLLPGSVTIFSLEMKNFNELQDVQSKTYNAIGSYGSYSDYYKLNMAAGGYVDISTVRASVYAYNKTLFANDGMPLNAHYKKLSGNTYLEPGEYLLKFEYEASLSPGTVSFQKS